MSHTTDATGDRGVRAHAPLLAVTVLALALLLASVPVRAPPPQPMVVRGHAYDAGGSPLPLGTPIRAFIDGVQYSNDSHVVDAAGAFAVAVYGNWMLNASTPETPTVKEGANLGETVILSEGDFTGATPVFRETIAWYPGALLSQDLHLGSTATTPSPLKLQAIVTEPAAGTLPYLFVCNPSAAAVSLADYYLQTDIPGSYAGPIANLSGSLGPSGIVRKNLTSPSMLHSSGDALKLVYRNPASAGATAGGRDVVVDRIEYNATTAGSLDWEPGNTILGDAPAPGIGRILERTPACADTNAPADLKIDFEPGVTNTSHPTVAITAPSDGQNVPGGSPFTLTWTMTDPVFATTTLSVWANLTCQGSTAALVAGGLGVTSVRWDVPNVAATGCSLQVDVRNAYGGSGTSRVTFSVQPSEPWTLIVALLLILVVAVFLLLAWRSVRKRAAAPPPVPPTAVPPSTAAAQPAAGVTAPPGTKACPRCHTVVRAEDQTCFFCGYAFSPPP